MSRKRWSVLAVGYGLILLVTVMLCALVVPQAALADGNMGGGFPPPCATDTTLQGDSTSSAATCESVSTDPSLFDLLLITMEMGL